MWFGQGQGSLFDNIPGSLHWWSNLVSGEPNTNSAVGKFWDDITGLSNTKTQNSAAAALQEDAQEFSASEAQKERDWQTQMSNTAYQRSMADLQAAGLNPALAASAPASSGQGAFASSGVAGSQASNVNMLASLGTAAAGIGLLIKAIKTASK